MPMTTPSDRPLGLGVVGVGALAIRGIVPHLVQSDLAARVRVVALCDPVVDRARAVAREHGIPNAYATIEELLADDAVEAVSIASPIGLHFEHCRLALAGGRHVHVNKTMTTTVAEADALIDLANERGLRLVASPGEALRPHVIETRRLIAAGAIGRPTWAVCGAAFATYHEDETERTVPGGRAIDPSWYFRRPGGGPMYDMTVYALHELTAVLGPARRVAAMSGVRVPTRTFLDREIPTEADDNTTLLLDFGESLFALAYGVAAGALTAQFGTGTYFGTRGVIQGVLLNGEPFRFPGQDRMTGGPAGDQDDLNRALPHVVGAHATMPEAHVFEDLMQLVDAVQTGSPAPSADQARHVIDIIEAGYRAATTGVTQELATTFSTAD
jgi:predicted dehydrogenase